MIKRILFVDNNPLLLDMYAGMLDDARDQWEVATSADGSQALELMKNSAFDVVLSDMRLGGMSGIEFMGEVKQQYPHAARVLLAGYSEQEEFARSLDATHQFLAKPFDVKALKALLSRIGGLDVFLKDEKLQTLASRLGSLPSFPSLYAEIMKELNTEEPSIEKITGIVVKDPSMTARVLQVVNSAVVGLPQKVGSPFEAIQYLGIGTVRSLALSAPIFSCFERKSIKGFSVGQLWDHGMRTAQIARAITRFENAGMTDVEDAFTAGMLHDIGKLMLADNLAVQFQQALALAGEKKIPLHEAELEIFGATHAGVAAYLLGLWGLPSSIVEAVAFHHTPGQGDKNAFGPLGAVHVANVLEQELSKAGPGGKPAELDAGYLAALGLQDRTEVWRNEAAKQIASDDHP